MKAEYQWLQDEARDFGQQIQELNDQTRLAGEGPHEESSEEVRCLLE